MRRYIYRNYFLSKIVLLKILKNSRVKSLLIMNFGRKSNWGHEINCQGRYLHEVGKEKLFLEIYGQHYQYIYRIYYIVYSSFISRKLQGYMSSNGVYTDVTPHYWTQAVESFGLKYDFMHMHCWKFNLFF